MMREYMRSLYAYNTWANQRVLDAARHLSRDQLHQATHVGFGSIHDDLVHIVSVQRYWLARARRQPSPGDLAPTAFGDVDTICTTWRAIDEETHRFVDALDDADLRKIVTYTNAHGDHAYPLWQLLFHQVNHAGQHRGEVALLLTACGHAPGWLDYLVYVDQAKGKAQ